MSKAILLTESNELTRQQQANKVFDELDVSDTTREDYKARIGLFLNFVADQGFTHNSFLAFKRDLGDRSDYTVSTKNKYLAAARVFLKELNRQGILPADITQNIKGFQQSRKHKREGVNEDELSRIIDNLGVLESNIANARLKAIMALLALQGLRQVEVIRLDVRDIDLVRRVAMIHGKGRDDKEPIDLHPETVATLKEYLDLANLKDGPLFTSLSNNRRGKRLSTRAIRMIIKQTLNSLDIQKTTHGFRHYFATKLLKVYKGDVVTVSKFTRHRSIETLQAYNDDLKREAALPKYYAGFAGLKF